MNSRVQLKTSILDERGKSMNAINFRIGLEATGNKQLNQQKEGFHSLRGKRDAFKDILKSAPANGETKPTANHSALIDKLQMFIGSWERLDNSIKERFRALPKESRSLIELQYLANNIHLQSEMVAKAGEAAGNSIKRIHQMGSN